MSITRKGASRGLADDAPQSVAIELEKEVKKYSESSDKSMEHHHRFAYSVTMFQISIALAAVAALSRKKMVWYARLLIAVLGLLYFADTFWLYF